MHAVCFCFIELFLLNDYSLVCNVLFYLLFSSFSGTSDTSKNSLLITSNTTAGLPQGPKKEPPPPPPPRPKHNHIRSSSLDLNRLGILLFIS